MCLIYLATEDELSEVIGARLIREVHQSVNIQPLRKGGNGYLRSRIDNFIEMANHNPVLLLTDLDNLQCPPQLISDWFGQKAVPNNLLFRVVIREIEAWLLADHEGMTEFMGARVAGQLPRVPETLIAPKETLLQIARRAKRDVKADIVRENGSSIMRAVGYNQSLSTFVRNGWCPIRASVRSASLRRARAKIAAFSTSHHPCATPQ